MLKRLVFFLIVGITGCRSIESGPVAKDDIERYAGYELPVPKLNAEEVPVFVVHLLRQRGVATG